MDREELGAWGSAPEAGKGRGPLCKCKCKCKCSVALKGRLLMVRGGIRTGLHTCGTCAAGVTRLLDTATSEVPAMPQAGQSGPLKGDPHA